MAERLVHWCRQSGLWGAQFAPHVSLLWPIGFAIGCIAYFSIPAEPGRPIMMGALGSGFILLVLAPRFRERARLFAALLILAACLLGTGRSWIRTQEQARPDIVPASENAVTVTGWVRAIERTAGNRTRLFIEVESLDGEPAESARIRVLAQPGGIRPGETISLRAVLNPPGRPVVPGSYDFGFQAYFRRIIATGYAVTPASRIDDGGRRSLEQGLAGLRWRIAERIRSRLDGRNGGIAAALLTGDRSGIRPEDADVLRASGLGHVLAISGLHMALFAGGVFMAVRLFAALFIPWARRSDAAKPAAIAALMAALAYLFLSGASIPTQRAFIMTAAVLGAVLFERRALTMHTLAVAMSLVLLIQPEAIMGAGFQMSFAAVGALIAVHEALRNRQRPRAPGDRPGFFLPFLGGLSLTSLIAGSATAGFAAFHFHRIASLGMLGNLLAMPVFTLVVMPAGVLALALMPFGLDGLPLAAMSIGLDLVFLAADWIAGLPGALVPVAAAPGGLLAIYALAFAGLVLGRRLVRISAAVLAAAVMLVWSAASQPHLFVTEDGVVIAQFDGQAWSSSAPRRARFDTRVFLERQGAPGRAAAAGLDCDRLGCTGMAGGVAVTVQTSIEAWREDCARSDLIIARAEWPAWIKRQCGALVLDAGTLLARGGVLVWTQDGRIGRTRHVEDGRAGRPWSLSDQ